MDEVAFVVREDRASELLSVRTGQKWRHRGGKVIDQVTVIDDHVQLPPLSVRVLDRLKSEWKATITDDDLLKAIGHLVERPNSVSLGAVDSPKEQEITPEDLENLDAFDTALSSLCETASRVAQEARAGMEELDEARVATRAARAKGDKWRR
jgi:hypothetical protein